jgi:hypothetical protein
VHGEEKSAVPFMDILSKQGMHEVYYPDLHDSADL